MRFFSVLVMFLVLPLFCSSMRDLNETFLEESREGEWLVMFFVPWCAYCKGTEPLLINSEKDLEAENVKVGRLDCVRYPAVAKKFKVHGYPTIMYIKDNAIHHYVGYRVPNHLVHFIRRMRGLPVEIVGKNETIARLKEKQRVFFVFAGFVQDSPWEAFEEVAKNTRQHAFFYITTPQIASKLCEVIFSPTIFAYKEGKCVFFPSPPTVSEKNFKIFHYQLQQWVNSEIFPIFPELTVYNFDQLKFVKKYSVFAVTDTDKLKAQSMEEVNFVEWVNNFAFKFWEHFHEDFQFGWTGDTTLAYSIILQDMPTPYLFVKNVSDSYYYLPVKEATKLTEHDLHKFLEDVVDNNVIAYGGDTLQLRFKRKIFDFKQTVLKMWKANHILTILIFIMFIGFFLSLFYAIFTTSAIFKRFGKEPPNPIGNPASSPSDNGEPLDPEVKSNQ